MHKTLIRSTVIARLAIAALAISAAPAMAASAVTPAPVVVQGKPLRGQNVSDVQQWEELAKEHATHLSKMMRSSLTEWPRHWSAVTYRGASGVFSDTFNEMLIQHLSRSQRMFRHDRAYATNAVRVTFDYLPQQNTLRITSEATESSHIVGSYSTIHDVKTLKGAVVPVVSSAN